MMGDIRDVVDLALRLRFGFSLGDTSSRHNQIAGDKIASGTGTSCSGDFYALVARGHRFAFAVADHHAHDVAPGRHVEDFFDGDAGALQPGQGLVAKTQLDYPLDS